MAGLRRTRVIPFDSGSHIGYHLFPYLEEMIHKKGGTSDMAYRKFKHALVVKQANTVASKATDFGLVGSTPIRGTMWKRIIKKAVGEILIELLPTIIESIVSSIGKDKDPVDINRIAAQALRDSLDIE